MSNYISVPKGRNLIEQSVYNYSDIVGSYTKFVSTSQFDSVPKNIKELDFSKSYSGPKLLDEPLCGNGCHLYGVEKDGSLTHLKSILDTSG